MTYKVCSWIALFSLLELNLKTWLTNPNHVFYSFAQLFMMLLSRLFYYVSCSLRICSCRDLRTFLSSQAMWLTFSYKKLPQSFVFKLLHFREKINHFSLFALATTFLKATMLFLQGLSDFLFVFCLMLAGERNDELEENGRVMWQLS